MLTLTSKEKVKFGKLVQDVEAFVAQGVFEGSVFQALEYDVPRSWLVRVAEAYQGCEVVDWPEPALVWEPVEYVNDEYGWATSANFAHFHVCDHCAAPESVDDTYTVCTGYQSDEIWCTQCVNEYTSYCRECGTLSEIAEMTSTVSGLVCPNCCNDYFFTCTECNTLIHTRYQADEDICEECYRERRENRRGLQEYHAHSMSHFSEATSGGWPALGVELEVEAQRSLQDAVESLRDFDDNLLLEEDRSLCPERGFEIITQPMGHAEWATYGPGLIKTCQRARVVGYDASNGTYGIHITVHRRHVTPLQETRLINFSLDEENLTFLRAIAQRQRIYSATRDMGSGKLKVREMGRLVTRAHYEGDKKKLCIVNTERYAPVHVKSCLIEFRMFQSTVNLSSFMKNLEFVWAVLEWVREGSVQDTSYKHFVRWLGQRPKVDRDFPNLMEFLRRPVYRLRGIRTDVPNTWAHLLKPLKPKKREEKDLFGEVATQARSSEEYEAAEV